MVLALTAGGRVDPVAPAFSELGSGRVPATTRGATPWLVNIVPGEDSARNSPWREFKAQLIWNKSAGFRCVRKIPDVRHAIAGAVSAKASLSLNTYIFNT